MSIIEEKDGTYNLSGLTFSQLTSIISGLGCVTEKYKKYNEVQRKVYETSIKETNELLDGLDSFMMEGM